ncbi:MAG: ThiF family adenylyltransferase [Lachnospiraceae bacterium]|nr:ThiF family adenylyltransferase [Lachnospiraceae bacterium]
MFDFTERTELLIGEDNVKKLAGARVLLFGLGGVGGICAETLVRAGVGHLTCVDGDQVTISNINRQIIALHSTIGRFKTEVFRERAKDINPYAEINILTGFFGREDFPDNVPDFTAYDYVVDCIDDVNAKVSVIVNSRNASTPVISCMGAGNRYGRPDFVVCDLFKTSGDPLARVMRQYLRKSGIDKDVKCVISKVPPDVASSKQDCGGKNIISSISYSPAAEGIICASEVIRELISVGK